MPVAVVCIPLSFVFIVWLRRALKNVARRRLGAAGWLSRPSLQWWWLVPGVNLLAPLHVVAVLWRGTVDPSDPPGSAAWGARRLPLLLTAWWAGQVLAFLAVAFVVWRQPPFEEMWSCVWNPVTERPQDCMLTAQGRAAWERSDGILAGMFAAQVVLGLLFYRILGLLNGLQQRLLDANASAGRDGLWRAMTSTRG